MKKNPRILITCGETSGDLHAANLVSELRKRLPGTEIMALGGGQVEKAGAKLLYHCDDYSIIGFSGVLTNFPRLARLERRLKRVLENDEIDLYIPVDYPGLNLRLSEHAKKLGIPVLYYISPQVWAWGGGRVQKLARWVDYMAVILPFEEKIYKDQGVPVEFVGHPFVEDHRLPEPRDQESRSGIGLLPGSRPGEVRRILPLLLDAARRIHRVRPDERFSLGLSASVPRRVYRKILAACPLHITLDEDSLSVMEKSRLLLVASGTATLQGALFETPQIIVYRMSVLNYLIAKTLIKIDHIGLVNIILGEEVCPEFVQINAKPKLIADRAVALLENQGVRDSMVSRFGSLRGMLSGPGGCRRVAEISEQLLNSS